MSEQDPLLARNYATDSELTAEGEAAAARARSRGLAQAGVGLVLVLLLIVGVPVMIWRGDEAVGRGGLPRDPTKAAERVLSASPVIDGHIDLPELVRVRYANNVSAFDLEKTMPGEVDIPRLHKGRVGGFFWSVYTSCPKKESKDFLEPFNTVRDTLEQIDVAKLLVDKYSKTFHHATSVADMRIARAEGKIASLLGVEGAHQLGNSLAVLRQYYALGVRYVTLTHSCNNAFADSGGYFEAPTPVHGGLSSLGRTLIGEMNRLGMLIDLSHVSDETAEQAIELSQAPVMWSHSAVRALVDISRNVPDALLERIGTGKGKRDGVVMVNFAAYFIASGGGNNATVADVADHVEHIAKIAGKKHVGLGSDYDGVGGNLPEGLEDVSKYPNLFAELYRRGWNRYDLAGLAGANFVRVFEGVERTARELQNQTPAFDIYRKRKDLPTRKHEL